MAGQTASTSRSFALYADGTDIDRESCDRVVPMKVLALGLCRTGTLSLRSALKGLGYIDTYHMRSASTETPRDNEMWMRAIEAKFDGKGHFGKAGWDKLLGNCQAVCDFPGAAFGPELIAAYPDAKVIMTLRDADSWHLSTAKTVWKVIQDPTFRSLTFFNPTLRKYRLMISTLLDRFFQGQFLQNGKSSVKITTKKFVGSFPQRDYWNFGWKMAGNHSASFSGTKFQIKRFQMEILYKTLRKAKQSENQRPRDALCSTL
ncbi:hypothetical protein WAI453_008131 [Rhynchosporium graminicola]